MALSRRNNPLEGQKQRRAVADSMAAADSVAAEDRYQKQRVEGLRRLNSPTPKKRNGPIEGLADIAKGVIGAYKKVADTVKKAGK